MRGKTIDGLTIVMAMLTMTICFAFDIQQEPMSGVVILSEGEEMLSNVLIKVDQYPAVTSDAKGKFKIVNYLSNEKPINVSAVKEGYELSTWTYNNKLLSVFMRKATLMTVKGQLVDYAGKSLGNRKIDYMGTLKQSIVTNVNGNFEFKLPIKENVEMQGLFVVDGVKAVKDDMIMNTETASISLKLRANVTPNQTYDVNVKFENGNALKNELVMINNNSFLTDQIGTFRLPPISEKIAKWDISDHSIIRIDTIKSELVINVLLKSKSVQKEEKQNSQEADEDAHNIVVSKGIDNMHYFYSQQEAQLLEQYQQIKKINDRVSFMSDVKENEHDLLLLQLEKLSQSMENTTKAFNDTRDKSLEFVTALKTKLDEKDETIKEISEEKQQLATRFNENIKVLATVLLCITLLLLIAVETIRRFKVQKRVIERTKKQLLKAQEMARIGSMIYLAKEKCFTYSENFFNALRISNFDRIRKLRGKSEAVIFEDLIDVIDREKVRDVWKQGLQSAKQINVEFKGIADDGVPIYIDMNTVFEIDANDKISYISSTLQDVSEKKENELLMLKAIEEVKEATKIKEEFLAAMSHEIRTPLNAIIGLTDRLITENPSESQLKNLNIIQMSSEHLLALINDVLDFSKIRAGMIRIENDDFELKKLVDGIMKTMALYAGEKGVKLKLTVNKNVPDLVKGDKLRLSQILLNLVNNAVKFTEVGSVELIVSMEQISNEREQILFKVKDTGIGIANDKLDTIFESFQQENLSTSRKYGGTGLGLTISKNLVQLLGGDLKVISEQGVGSEFYFYLPYHKVEITSTNRTKNKSKDQVLHKFTGLRVLCIEDNEINKLVISQYFNHWEIEATYAETGQKALDEIANKNFDLIFMDIRLPDMNGYEITQRIQKDFPEKWVPVIAFTAEIDERTIPKIKDAGMVDYISKPFKSEDLHQIIQKYI